MRCRHGTFDLPPLSISLGLANGEEEEEEGLFKADAVNEEDPERDRATQVYTVEDLFRRATLEEDQREEEERAARPRAVWS